MNVVQEMAIAAGHPDAARSTSSTTRRPTPSPPAATRSTRPSRSRPACSRSSTARSSRASSATSSRTSATSTSASRCSSASWSARSRCSPTSSCASRSGAACGRSRRATASGGGGAQADRHGRRASSSPILAPIIARFVQLAVSRQREYLADASSVELTRNPYGLERALAKIAGDQEVLEVANRGTQHLYFVNPIKKFEERSSGLMSTHPPILDRINRLRELTGEPPLDADRRRRPRRASTEGPAASGGSTSSVGPDARGILPAADGQPAWLAIGPR